MSRGPAGPAPCGRGRSPARLDSRRHDGTGQLDGLSKAVPLLSLVAHQSGLTMAWAEVPQGGRDKTNEHKAALKLLPGLVLEGRLSSGDAIFSSAP